MRAGAGDMPAAHKLTHAAATLHLHHNAAAALREQAQQRGTSWGLLRLSAWFAPWLLAAVSCCELRVSNALRAVWGCGRSAVPACRQRTQLAFNYPMLLLLCAAVRGASACLAVGGFRETRVRVAALLTPPPRTHCMHSATRTQ